MIRQKHYAVVLASILMAAGVSVTTPAFAQENEDVEFAANLEYIRGHLAQALANKQAGNTELAIAHAGHPVHEIYALIQEELEEHSPELNEDIEEQLISLANQINSMQVQQVQTEVAHLNTLLDGAKDAVISEAQVSDPVFNAMVAAALLETAEHEYEEAVENGQIVEMIEYQDSTAFISRAETAFRSSVQAEMPDEEAEEVVELFEQLDSLTASNAGFEEVEVVISGIIHEFEEVFGFEEESGYDGQAYIDRIIELLDESVTSYKAGDSQTARAAAIEAYLDNYEFIEADIEEDDPELMEKIEVDMRVELVQMIDDGQPATEIEAHVSMIKADLETARQYVESTPPSETKGDSWNTINILLGEVEKLTGKNATATQTALEKLEQAKAKYEEVFAAEAEELDPATAQDIESAYANMQTAVESGTALQVTLNKQFADKLVYKIAFMKIEEEIFEEEVEEAAEWFTVMSKKFKYDQTPSNASRAMAELEADQSKAAELTPVILDDLKAMFALKVKEEITEALEAQSKQPPDNANAQKFVIEGIAYYRTIQPDVQKILGTEQEATLFQELEKLFEYAEEGNLAKMQEGADEISALLLAYEGKEVTGIGAAILEIIDLLQLVNIEYIDAVRDGQIINEEEYDETTVFITRATEKFDSIRADLMDVAAEKTAEVDEGLSSIAAMVQNKDNPQKVSDTVQQTQHELEEILQASGSDEQGTDGWGYIDRINTLLDKVIEEYKAGKYQEARDLAREAYLDNYEFIEADIAEEDQELMEKVEIDMRVNLVQMIDDKRPSTEIESHVQQIKADLETARAIVTPEFPAAIIAIVAAMAVFVAASRFRGSIFSGRLPP